MSYADLLDRKGVDGSGDNHRHPQDDLEQGPHFLVKTFEKRSQKEEIHLVCGQD